MKYALTVCFLSFFLIGLQAQVPVPADVTRQADNAFAKESARDLGTLLASSSSSAWYPRLESYVLRKVRQYVIENKLEIARVMTLSVIDNNLDNTEAVDLYQSIQKAIARQEAEKKKAEEEKQVAAFKQQADDTKIKQDLAKTYQTVTNSATGKKVYLDQDFNAQYRSWNWDYTIGLAHLSYHSAPNEEDSLKYGLSAGGSAVYNGESVRFGLEASGDALFMAFSGDTALDWTGGAGFGVSTKKINPYFTLRGGFRSFGWNYGSLVGTTAFLATPTVGLGFRDVPFLTTGRFSLHADYLAASLYSPNLVAGAEFGMKTAFMFADMQDFDFFVYLGIRDTILLTKTGLKNDARAYLAIGVADYE